jgi:DNA-binding Lrp family transcriptional regulator
VVGVQGRARGEGDDVTDIDIDKLEELREEADRRFIELHEAYKSELFLSAPALIAEIRRLRAIEAAAVEHARVCDLLREEYAGQSLQTFAALKAALAAKENEK